MGLEIRVTETCVRRAEDIYKSLVTLRDHGEKFPATAKNNLRVLKELLDECNEIIAEILSKHKKP
jgi:hypothetical protein